MFQLSISSILGSTRVSEVSQVPISGVREDGQAENKETDHSDEDCWVLGVGMMPC
jgi:hypothetical protein